MLGKVGVGIGIVVVAAMAAGSLTPYQSKATARLNSIPSTSSAQNGPPDVSNASKWVMTFDDEFNGNKLDASKWVTCYDSFRTGNNGCTNTGNAEQEWYTPEQVSVANGVATLTAVQQPIAAVGKGGGVAYQYRSGMISTGRPSAGAKPKWTTTYGYFVARINFDGGQGIWPAFWLLPASDTWPPEIDIMEHLGNEPKTVLLTVHWPSKDGPKQNGTPYTGPDFVNGWHTYAVDWQPGHISWYVDGVLRKTFTGNNVPSTPMEMILNLAVGGRLPGNVSATTPFPRTMQIDYVRVYELKK